MKHSVTAMGKKGSEGFSDSVRLEKQERIARASLMALITFNDTLEAEMLRMQNDADGAPMDLELFDRMVLVRDKYNDVMRGFQENTLEQQSHAMIVLADSMQDLMKLIYKRQAH